jgi:CubicO group peptidase (beta-lactamase class C family)
VRADTGRALEHRLAVEQSERRLPSLVAGLVRRGELIWCAGAGAVAQPAATQYRCGSITKTFVAVEVMRLRDEGMLDLADLIGDHLPAVTQPRASVAQLLAHTSGLRAETAGPWWERTPGIGFDALVAGSMRPEDVLVRPGRRFHYSNVGYAVLGELVSRIRGRRWDDVVGAELLRPLEMERTSTRPVAPFAEGYGVHPHAPLVLAEPEHDAVSMAPAGQLWSTAEDLARWARVLAGYEPQLLAAETLEEMLEPAALADPPGQPWTTAHGLGIQLFNVNGERSWGHWGSMPGHVGALIVDASTRDAVVVLSNATSGLSGELPGDLLRILREHEPPAPSAARARQPADALAEGVLELAGAWYWGTAAFVLSVTAGGHLELRALDRGRESSFRPTGPDSYVGLSGYYHGETLRIVRRRDGSVSHLDIGSFVFSRRPYDPAADIPGGVDAAGWQESPLLLEGEHGGGDEPR